MDLSSVRVGSWAWASLNHNALLVVMRAGNMVSGVIEFVKVEPDHFTGKSSLLR